jgi:sugar/nucleoside kinase (ribokinase family)
MNRAQLKEWWDYLQSLADVDGDCWLGLFTAAIVFRLVAAAFGKAAITAAEAAAYGSAIGAFAYSNKGPRT